MSAIARFFELKERGTTVGTEVRAGVVTFMTMAYIIVVQPMVLADAGMPMGGVMLATCLSSAIATLLIGLLANYPVAMAPCMGHNFYFAFLVMSGVVPSWREALGAVFVSGSLFLVLSLFGFRERVMNAVPDSLKYAIAVGIGLLIALVGLRSAGLVVELPDATGWTIGKFTKPVVLAAIGLAITAGLMAFRVRGAILIGLVATALVGMGMGLVKPVGSPVSAPPWDKLKETALGFDPIGLFRFAIAGKGAFLGVLGVVFTFFFLDLFDAIGTLIGVTQQAGLMVDGKLPKAREALFSDAAGTVVGAVLGTSTVSAYIESSAGVSEGGRTGLANVVTAALFVLSIFFYPCVEMIAGGVPAGQTLAFEQKVLTSKTGEEFETLRVAVAPPKDTNQEPRPVPLEPKSTLLVSRTRPLSPVTAPTLILIGCLIISVVARIPWHDWTEAVPAFLAMIMMPMTFNITEGIAFGFISYTFLKVVTGRAREVSPWVAIFAVLFVARYAYEAL